MIEALIETAPELAAAVVRGMPGVGGGGGSRGALRDGAAAGGFHDSAHHDGAALPGACGKRGREGGALDGIGTGMEREREAAEVAEFGAALKANRVV